MIINNYQLLKDTGFLEYTSSLRVENRALENLIAEAYEIFSKESVEELVNFVIECLSDKFVPSNLIFILNQGIMVNRIKTLIYRNLKQVDSDLKIDSLEPYESFFRKYSGTSSFLILESEIADQSLLSPLSAYEPEIVVPIIGRSGLYGIILFGPKVLGQEYSLSEIAYIDRLSKFTSIGIQNNIHYEHSVREPKTGLYNHNFFIRRVSEDIARAKRTGRIFSVIIIDIDNFKEFNDTYGHLAGDEMIIRLAGKIIQVMREEDILSRFGGEEFTILLPATDCRAAWTAAERLRTAVEAMTITYEGRTLNITISLGLASYDPKSGDDENIMRRADAALYRSKQKGRNRTSLSRRHDN